MGGKAEERFTARGLGSWLLCNKGNSVFAWAADVVCASVMFMGSEGIIVTM